MPDFTLNDYVIDAVRFAASQIRDFKQGAIVLRYIPAPEAIGWFGPNVYVNLTYSIVPDGTTTRAAGWRGNPDNPEIDCARDAALKLEGCAFAVAHKHGRCSDDLPDDAVADNMSNDSGAVCFDLIHNERGNPSTEDRLYLRLFISVSGATGEENKYCAYQAMQTLMTLFVDEPASDLTIEAPNYEPDFAKITLGKITPDKI